MKCVLVVLGGAADRPRKELDGRTPLAVARTPTLDALAENGKVGRVCVLPAGTEPSQEAILQTLLGLRPEEIVTGGGVFAAVGLGAEIGASDVAYRLSFVTTLDGALVDPTAGGIGTPEARLLLDALGKSLASMHAGFTAGEGHAHVLVARDRPEVASTRPPHEMVGQPLEENLPSGPEGAWLRGIMDRAGAVLSEHEVNRIRVDLGENPADAVWPWAGGRLASLPSLDRRLGLPVAGVTDDPLVAGLAAQAGIRVNREPPSAEAAVEALTEADLVLVHVSGPARAAATDAGAKVRAIESLDRELLAPLVEKLSDLEPHRLLVVADDARPTPGLEVPFLLCGEGVASVRRFPFDETGAESSDLHVDRGHLLLDHLLARPARPGSSGG